ncbi:TetR/AcrR family transcriptional regulator [Paenibacillus soyae]|uniref:TetR/AcrR family transcriptional regulator n=1 Tax=Paenibacillus soyae TaxID=2969249 RepID=A0A9X2MQG8_9BACL|nr:TetR/AcrR family transcriptional regulator [Paenibacillus soyae]MCR2803988.1 TetR/AcrR family transcriptional regulator [Paenibacillus soyae]
MKERIAQAAAEEMARRGLKFSIREIAASLGASTKTIYQHFESKEQILGYILERAVDEMRESERKIMNDGTLSVQHKLRQALLVLPNAFVFHDIRILHELKQRYPEHWRTVDAYVNQSWDQIRLLFEEGATDGVIRQVDVELFIQVYVGAFYRIMEDSGSVSRKGYSFEQALEGMVDLLLEGVWGRE